MRLKQALQTVPSADWIWQLAQTIDSLGASHTFETRFAHKKLGAANACLAYGA